MDYKTYAEELGKKAREASRKVKTLSTEQKNKALELIAQKLEENAHRIIEANRKDMEYAESKGYTKAKKDRLLLNEKRILGMASAIRDVASLEDPVGKVLQMTRRPNGLLIGKVKVPIGVILMIYEARPNVTTDVAALALKSGNVVILRGGSDAYNSNKVLVEIVRESLKEAGIVEDAVQMVEITDHDFVPVILKQADYIDLVIPRGSERLIRAVVEESKIPVLRHEKGVCHVFVDASADKEMAERITVNSKVQRPSVCNAAETLLIHKDYPYKKELLEALAKEGVEIRGDEEVVKMYPSAKPATEEDWYTEYLDYIISVKIVSSLDEAVDHIEKYGTHHSDAIVTKDYDNAMKFLNEVDSSAVYVNASTRFTDGGEFGLGAEIGINTSRLHARGPMGLMELTTEKWIVFGSGQIRE